MPATLTAVLAAQRADTACRPTGQVPVPGDQVARLLDGACTELVATERERCLRLAITAAGSAPECEALAGLVAAIRDGARP